MRFCERRLQLRLIDMLVLLSESSCQNVNPSARPARRTQPSPFIICLLGFLHDCMVWFLKMLLGMRNSAVKRDQIRSAGAEMRCRWKQRLVLAAVGQL